MTWDHQSIRLGAFPIHRDARGSLVVAEFGPLPFVPQRLFWLVDIVPGETRANHAHRVCEQLVFCQTGSVAGRVTGPDGQSIVFRLQLGDWIVIPTRHWLTLEEFSTGCVVGVFASHPFDADEYIDSPDDLASAEA